MKLIFYRKSLKYYLIFTFFLTFGAGLIVYSLGGLEKNPALSAFIMFIPAIVAITVTIRLEKRKGFSVLAKSFGFRLGKIKYLFIYPITMLIIVILIYLATYFISPGIFISTTTTELPEVLSELSIEFVSLPIYLQVISIFFLNSIIGSIINIPLFFGEEIGWRAFLYPRLETYYQKHALLIGGVIWGVWHGPMILMGHNYPSLPFIGLFVMILLCIPLGIILYYIYCQSGSIITVALCHGVLNQTASTVHMIFIDADAIQPIVHGPTGLIGIIIFSLIAFTLYRKWVGQIVIKE